MAKGNNSTKRIRLHNPETERWELWTVSEIRLRPWRALRLGLIRTSRAVRDFRNGMRRYPEEYLFDESELRMKRPDRVRHERREERRGQWAERFRRIADAVISMVEMQKFIN